MLLGLAVPKCPHTGSHSHTQPSNPPNLVSTVSAWKLKPCRFNNFQPEICTGTDSAVAMRPKYQPAFHEAFRWGHSLALSDPGNVSFPAPLALTVLFTSTLCEVSSGRPSSLPLLGASEGTAYLRDHSRAFVGEAVEKDPRSLLKGMYLVHSLWKTLWGSSKIKTRITT